MTSLKNKNIDSFIQEQLKLIEPFQVIDLPLNDNIIENLDVAVKDVAQNLPKVFAAAGEIDNFSVRNTTLDEAVVRIIVLIV